MMKLNLGCGLQKIDNFVGVDCVKTLATDIVWDLNDFPYPFENEVVDEIIVDNVLEHLDDVVEVMKEVNRICAKGAIVRIKVPYYKSSGAYTDPGHKNFFTEKSFDFFSDSHEYSYYTDIRFKILKNELICFSNSDFRHKLRNMLPFKKFFNYFLTNIYDEIDIELKCIKK